MTPSPIDAPAIVIDGRKYTLKYSLLADYVLDKRGIDTTKIIPILKSPTPGQRSLIIELFAAVTAHNFVEAGEPILTPEQWCLRLTPEVLAKSSGLIVKALYPNAPAPPEAVEEQPAAQPVQ